MDDSTGNAPEHGAEGLDEACLRLAIAHYLKPGGDFSGLPLGGLSALTGSKWPALQAALLTLVQNGLANVHWSEVDVNPHINRLGFAPAETQVQHLTSLTRASEHVCLFPAQSPLSAANVAADFAGRPYTSELALGAPQLDFRSFDVQVLEAYRNDPRYYYHCSDSDGSICISTEGTDGTFAVKESDQVLVQTFGFSYDAEGNRFVAVFLRYLHDLSSEHQLIWRSRQTSVPVKLHPDYYKSLILGSWALHIPLLQALCIELWLINKMSTAIRGKPIFRTDFGEYAENRPKKLGLLIRPTLEEFNAGVHLLDKVLSENLSKEYFEGLVSLEAEKEREDGKIVVSQKGTLALLDDYLRSVYRTSDWSPWVDAMAALRKVRRLRQKPAHAVNEDVFDPKYARDFRELCVDAYSALATLRNCLQQHPAVGKAAITVPNEIQDGKVWTM